MYRSYNKDFLQKQSQCHNILRTEKVKAMRGVIYDRHGVPTIISPVMKVVIDPRDYFEAKKQFDEITANWLKTRLTVNP